jgi:hypothetical protein
MNQKILIIGSIVALLIGLGSYYGVTKYREYKCESIIEQTKTQLNIIKSNILGTKSTIEQTGFILVKGEKANLIEDLDSISEELPPIEGDVQRFFKLGDTQLIRAKLEVGFDDVAIKDGYKTPIQRIEMLTNRIDKIKGFCSNREEIRNRVVYNEMLLKAILKKPTSGIELPQDLMNIKKYAPKLLSLIPQDTEYIKKAISYIQDTNLNNSMGAKLYEAIPIVVDIKSVALANDIKYNAEDMWNSAKKSFSAVKGANDDTHWYMPSNDDGKYDTEAYARLLSTQSKALSWYEAGNAFLDRLSNYRAEIKSQKLVFVSSNSYYDTSYRHSRQVSRTAYRTKQDGTRVSYTKYDTEYYSTPGRIFYYTVTTIDGLARSDNRIEVGHKDSESMLNSFGGWRTWDYTTQETQGYLIEYKPYGYDNRSRVAGGRYNPSIHIIR